MADKGTKTPPPDASNGDGTYVAPTVKTYTAEAFRKLLAAERPALRQPPWRPALRPAAGPGARRFTIDRTPPAPPDPF